MSTDDSYLLLHLLLILGVLFTFFLIYKLLFNLCIFVGNTGLPWKKLQPTQGVSLKLPRKDYLRFLSSRGREEFTHPRRTRRAKTETVIDGETEIGTETGTAIVGGIEIGIAGGTGTAIETETETGGVERATGNPMITAPGAILVAAFLAHRDPG